MQINYKKWKESLDCWKNKINDHADKSVILPFKMGAKMTKTEIKLTLFLDNNGREDWKIESSRSLPSDVIAAVFEGLAKQIRDKNPKHYEEIIRGD